jgi:small-conductance mechanosensitive channel
MFVILIMSVLLIFGNTVKAANAKQLKLLTGKEKKQPTEEVQLPEKLDSEQIDAFLATLSDEQVRRLLIQELQEKAALEAAEKGQEEERGHLTEIIHDMKRIVSHARDRIRFLMSGASAVNDDLPEAFAQLMEMEYRPNPLKAIVYLLLLFAAALFVDWLFRRYTAPARRRLEDSQPANWKVKLGRLALRSLLDFASICVLALAALTLFYIFLDDGRPMRFLLVITYLDALLLVWGVRLVSHLILSPSAGSLRFLPIKDENTRYIHKWLMAISAVGSFGWLTCGLLGLQGISEAQHLLLVAMVGLIIGLMLVVMIVQKRRPVAEALLREDLPDSSLRPYMARIWHRLAILYVFAVWAVWAISLLVVGPREVLAAVVTILSIPIYFLLDWGLRKLLDLGSVHYHQGLGTIHYHNHATDDTSEVVGNPGTAIQENNPEDILRDEPLIEESKISRHTPLIRRAFRILLAAGLFFLILRLWGIDLPLAIMFTENALAVVLTIVIAFVGWQFTKAYIDRRLEAELPDDDEEIDEGGGKGGTRRGTLLVLLRKFILAVLVVMVSLIVLSALGVNIGPLIAGAGIIGIAIGFGAQTGEGHHLRCLFPY